MGRLEKLLRDMRTSPTTVRYDEVERGTPHEGSVRQASSTAV